MKNPIVIDPPGFSQDAAWKECRDYVEDCGGLDHEDGSVNWRAAFGADPGCCSCPKCGEMYWAWGRKQRCVTCGFEYPTDWWPRFSEGCQHGLLLGGHHVCPDAEFHNSLVAKYQRDKQKNWGHLYYRFGFEHPCRDAWFWHDKIDWERVIQGKESFVYPLVENGVSEQIKKAFTYHRPRGDQPERYGRLRDKAGELALLFATLAPNSRERSLALTKLEEAAMWINAAIARNEAWESDTKQTAPIEREIGGEG